MIKSKTGTPRSISSIVIRNCTVNYKGRAESKLESGDRIVIIKSDGSLLVHRPYGYEPVNWQPPGCRIDVIESEHGLKIRAVRIKPPEFVNVIFNNLNLVAVFNLVDKGEFSMYASEKDMQKAILLNPSLIEEGFKPISYEKKVEPGFVDVYGLDSSGRLVVIEIKRRTAGVEDVRQLAKYVEYVKSTSNRNVRGILVAPSISSGAKRLIESLNLEFKFLSPKKCAEMIGRREKKSLTEFLS